MNGWVLFVLILVATVVGGYLLWLASELLERKVKHEDARRTAESAERVRRLLGERDIGEASQ